MTFLYEISHQFCINTKPLLHEIAHSFKIKHFLHEIVQEYRIEAIKGQNFCTKFVNSHDNDKLDFAMWFMNTKRRIRCELDSVKSNSFISAAVFYS